MLIKGHGLKAKSKYSVLAVFRYLNYFHILGVKFLKETCNLHFCVNPPPDVLSSSRIYIFHKKIRRFTTGSDYCNTRLSRNIQFEINNLFSSLNISQLSIFSVSPMSAIWTDSMISLNGKTEVWDYGPNVSQKGITKVRLLSLRK